MLGQSPHGHTTPYSGNRLAGVWKRITINPIIADVANLAHLHEEGYQSRSLNGYMSAISSVHDTVDGIWSGSGQAPMTMKEAYHARPPLPRYTSTWNVQIMLQ